LSVATDCSWPTGFLAHSLDRRIGDRRTLATEIAAWEAARDATAVAVAW
jgi:hypothetical protein